MKRYLIPLFLACGALTLFAERTTEESSQQALAKYPALGKEGSPFNREFLRRLKIYVAEDEHYKGGKDWPLNLADEVAKDVDSYAAQPEIEFKVLLIIKKISDTYHPLFLPVRSEMAGEDIAKARHCFEIQTPDMVHDVTRGKVKFTPTVLISEKPLRFFNPKRRDSAEYMSEELRTELASFAKPGDFDSVGYYFLYYDNASGYRIPRAGYGVGGFDGNLGGGAFAVGSASNMNPRDEIFLHEWIHGLEGYYGGKSGVRLAKGGLHGSGNYDARYGKARAWRSRDTFRGYMEWMKDLLNGQIQEVQGFSGLGEAAWKHGPMREEAKKKGSAYPVTPLTEGAYPEWVYELMHGELKNAKLGPVLLPGGLQAGKIVKDSSPWRLEMWNGNAKTSAQFSNADGGTFLLDCPAGNHATLVCELPLEALANYVFTAEVKTERIKIEQAGGRYAALISAEDSQSTRDFSGSVDWTPVVLPFTTKPNRQTATLRLQIGGISSLASGRAWFRNLKLQKIAYPE